MVGLPLSWDLADPLVHGADALRPAGIMPIPPAADVLVAFDTYMKWSPRVVHAVPDRGVSLAATDADWRRGSGPEVRGKAIDLLLLVADRLQVDCLDGPGVGQLDIWPSASCGAAASPLRERQGGA